MSMWGANSAEERNDDIEPPVNSEISDNIVAVRGRKENFQMSGHFRCIYGLCLKHYPHDLSIPVLICHSHTSLISNTRKGRK